MEQIVADGPGLVIVAGLDPRPLAAPAAAGGFLPSGRSTIFRILVRQMLTAHSRARAVVVAETKDTVRIPNQLRRQVEFSLVKPPFTYADQIATQGRAEILVIDRLSNTSAPAALEAAQKGLRVLSQIDTVFSGADIARYLLDLGVPRESLAGLTWVVAVQ